MSNSPSSGGDPLFPATLLREILDQCQPLIAGLEYLRDDQDSMPFRVLDQVVRRDAHDLAALARKVRHDTLVELCNYSPLVFREPEEVLCWAVRFEAWCKEYLDWLDSNYPADAAQAASNPDLANPASGAVTRSQTEALSPGQPPIPEDERPTDPTVFTLGDWDFSEAGIARYRGKEIKLAQKRLRALLARLVQNRGRAVAYTVLKETCGNDQLEDGTLRGYISQLNKLLRKSLQLAADNQPINHEEPTSYRLTLR